MQLDAISGQRRRGTVLFADMVGFTSFAERAGAEDAFELIRIVSVKMQEAVQDHGGTIAEYRGDGVMALFSVTSALEDGALNACRAALQIQSAMLDIQNQMMARFGLAPQVRIGIHSGPVAVGAFSNEGKARVSIVGDAVNVTARLESMAGHGEIFISSELFALVEGRVDAKDLGLREMKGKSEPQRVVLLLGIKEGVTRFKASVSLGLSALTERDDELARLQSAFAAATSGHISAVTIKGEAGIGKSRMLYEFEHQLAGKGANILKGDCQVDGLAVPFMPFAFMLRSALSLTFNTSNDDLEQSLRRFLGNLEMEVDVNLPYLMGLLGKSIKNDPGQSADMFGDKLRQLIVAILMRLCERSSVVLIIEDLHWSDPATVQIIDRLVKLEQDIPLMIICTYRPEFRPTWLGHERVVAIDPKPLTGEGVAALVQHRLDGNANAAAMVQMIVDKADGNPLYAEEIAKLLVQRRQGDGVKAAANDGTVVLPTNLQNMVMERYDRLDAEQRKILQAAACIGRQFDGRVASRIAGVGTEFDSAVLDQAIAAELVLPVGGMTTDYQFKHALVQDAIRDTLLQGQKRLIHERIGLDLEERFAGRIEEVSERLALHFNLAEIPQKAATYLIAAGARNLQLFSLSWADDAFKRAFDLIEEHDLDLEEDTLAELFASWFEVQQWQAEFGKTTALFEQQSHRMRMIADNRRYARILGLVGIAHCQNLRFDLGAQQLDQAITIGESKGDRDAIVYSCLGLMAKELGAPKPGFFERTAALGDRIKTLLGNEDHPYYQTYLNFYVNWSHSIHGNMDVARRNGHDLIEMGQRSGFKGAIGWGSICVAFNEAYCENFPTAIAFASLGEQSAGGEVDRLVCQGLKGFSMVMNGDVSGGATVLNEILAKRDVLEHRGIDNIVDGPIGLAKFLGGDMAGGLRWIEDSAARAKSSGNSHGEAMSYISLGTIHFLLATATEKPSLAMLRRNGLFLLKTLPFAKSRAVQNFDKAIEIGRRVAMHGVIAQALCGKGLALKAAKKTDAARSSLMAARETVSKIEWGMMRDRIESALTGLA